MENTLIQKKEGELAGSQSDKYFENVKDIKGTKLTKQDKRYRIIELMNEIYSSSDNLCILSNGEVVPIIIERTDKIGRKLRYFNNIEAPQSEVLKAFAFKTGIDYIEEKAQPKQIGDLISAEVNHLFDDIIIDNKKISSDKKQNLLVQLFRKLYLTPAENFCIINGKKYPIIIERLGYNNKVACCLNASEHRTEILSSFADWVGCRYCQEKEDRIDPPIRQKTEMSIRECAKIYHAVPDLDEYNPQKEGKMRLVDWFKHIYDNPKQNKVTLPNGAEAELIVQRKSCSRIAHYLNTSDENIKPFIIKRVADIIGATICIDNITINTTDNKILQNIIITTKKYARRCLDQDSKNYYDAYAQKSYNNLSVKKQNITVTDWLKNNGKID